MIKKLFKNIYKDIKHNYKIYIIYILFIIPLFIHFDYYIYSSGGLVDLKDRIIVDNSYETKGSINLTYVTVRKSNIYNILLSYIIPDWDLEKMDNSRLDNESGKEIFERDKIYLKETSYDAIIAAFEETNKPYNIVKNDVTITYVYSFAKSNVKVGDVVLSINDNTISNITDIISILNNLEVNDKLNIKVKRKNKEKDCYAYVVREKDRNVIGISIANIKEVTTTPKVEYVFEDNESGSSRGLMCAIDIYNKLTKYDITNGEIIAGTGTIDQDGKVSAIDGVKYKLRGAVKKKANVFIVPTDNYEEALLEKEKNNYDIEIIEANTLHDVIEKLLSR